MKCFGSVRKKENGFSLVELMVVVAVIAILAAISIPAILNWLPTYRLNNSIRDIYSAMQFARMQAIKRNTNVAILFDTNGGAPPQTYTIYLDTSPFDGDNLDAGETTLKIGTMPDDVDMYPAGTVIGAFGNKTYFTGRGMTNSGWGRVSLRNDRNRYKRVLLWNSGNIEVQESADKGVTWN